MAILHTPYREARAKETKVTGVVLPIEIYSYLSLYCLAKGMTKARAIREILSNWQTENKRLRVMGTLGDEDSLLNCLSNKIQIRWKEEKEKGKVLSAFRSQIKQELIDKGISSLNVLKILSNLK